MGPSAGADCPRTQLCKHIRHPDDCCPCQQHMCHLIARTQREKGPLHGDPLYIHPRMGSRKAVFAGLEHRGRWHRHEYAQENVYVCVCVCVRVDEYWQVYVSIKCMCEFKCRSICVCTYECLCECGVLRVTVCVGGVWVGVCSVLRVHV